MCKDFPYVLTKQDIRGMIIEVNVQDFTVQKGMNWYEKSYVGVWHKT